MDERTVARFWSKVERGDASECWDWCGHIGVHGYGRFGHDRRQSETHRLAWELTHGEIPAGMCVCHRCDRPSCCNPDHLFLGSQRDNMRDRDSKGRQVTPRGARNGNAKLSVEDVLAIRASTEPVRVLAKRFGVSRNHIYLVLNRTNWPHI